MIRDCYNALKQIEHQPAMYLGMSTLAAIKLFITGYYQALVDEKKVVPNSDTFSNWVAQKLDYTESTAGWDNMILAHSLGFAPDGIHWQRVLDYPTNRKQHEASVKYFYELLEDYMKEGQHLSHA